jgi:hypothetical protein
MLLETQEVEQPLVKLARVRAALYGQMVGAICNLAQFANTYEDQPLSRRVKTLMSTAGFGSEDILGGHDPASAKAAECLRTMKGRSCVKARNFTSNLPLWTIVAVF